MLRVSHLIFLLLRDGVGDDVRLIQSVELNDLLAILTHCGLRECVSGAVPLTFLHNYLESCHTNIIRNRVR